jgi:hypothetical protein
MFYQIFIACKVGMLVQLASIYLNDSYIALKSEASPRS